MTTSSLGDSIRNRVSQGASHSANSEMQSRIRGQVAAKVPSHDSVSRSAPEAPSRGVGALTHGSRQNYGSPEPGPAPAPAPAPKSGPKPVTPESTPSDDVGTRALDFGSSTNPNTGDQNWNLWCLGWVNEATKWANGGQGIPELQSGDAQEAYEKALANGKIHIGNPPKGAIVFFPGIVNPANGDVWGHVGISLGGGRYRGTVPPEENPETVGDRDIPGNESVPWMYAS